MHYGELFATFGVSHANLNSKGNVMVTNLESSSDYPPFSSDLSELYNINGVTKQDHIPKPDISTDKVQPPDVEVIDESEIIGEFVYGDICVENDDDGDCSIKK